MSTPLNVLSLFAGIGGLDLGLERAGMTVVGQVEIDPFCRRVLAKHWPEVPRHDDVRTCVEWWLGEPRPAVHVVAGGFPCQPVSVAGKQRAQADERWLWPEAWAVIRALRPDWAILENVPGLLGRGMGDILGDLAEGGYDAEWDCVPASTVGALHRRDRVFIVAYPNSERGWQQPVSVAECPYPAHTFADGAARIMADANSGAMEPRRRWRGVAGGGDTLADDTQGDRRGTGRQGRPAGDDPVRTIIPTSRLASTSDTFGEGRNSRWSDGRGSTATRGQLADWPVPTRGTWWAAEPDVGRVAYGVPDRVDRLRALGNAVVPQVAEHVGRLVIAAAQLAVSHVS